MSLKIPFYQIESEEREEDIEVVESEVESEEEEIEQSPSGESVRKYILKMPLLKLLDNYIISTRYKICDPPCSFHSILTLIMNIYNMKIYNISISIPLSPLHDQKYQR